MGFFDYIANMLTRGGEEHTNYIAPKVAVVLKNHGISCHCSGLAVPNMSKGKIYKCLKCDKQFANTYYDISQETTSYSSDIHNKAVELLKNNAA